jgi:hypothetical protein
MQSTMGPNRPTVYPTSNPINYAKLIWKQADKQVGMDVEFTVVNTYTGA